MIRIWNYNKSRIHSARGAREISLILDNKLIFRGELKKAYGNMSLKSSNNGNEGPFEMILLTNDEQVLALISNNDWINQIA